MSASDWSDDPDVQAWFQDVHQDLVPKLQNSGCAISIVPDETDVKFAVELGMSIMLDKPIILVVPSGVRVPERLARVADQIVEGDLNDNTYHERLQAAVTRVMGNG